MIAAILLGILLVMAVPVLILLIAGRKREVVAKAEAPDGRVELPRENDLQPRRWRMPDGSIIGEAVNREAVELLKNDPDEYFRRTGR